jgi:hypothetical protein
MAGKDGKPGAPGTEPAKDEKGEKVILSEVKVHSPYDIRPEDPENHEFYMKPGNYTIHMDVEAKEPLDFAVWDFIAYDSKDKEVGRIEQAVKIPYKSTKHLKWDSIYFQGRPDHFVVAYTDKKAAQAAEQGGGEGAPRGGASSGGGSSSGGSGGGGKRPGHTPDSPPSGGGEEGGGD